MISNTSTTDDRLLEIKVKQLRSYLQAKNIPHGTCTEKKELVDLIKQNRNAPFTNLSNSHTSQAVAGGATTTTTAQPHSSPKPGAFTNFQSTVSSFASQMNNIASNIQDYVTNTVSDAINTAVPDEPTPPPANPARPPPPQRPPPPPQQQQQAQRHPPPPPQQQQAQRPPPPAPSVNRVFRNSIENYLF